MASWRTWNSALIMGNEYDVNRIMGNGYDFNRRFFLMEEGLKRLSQQRELLNKDKPFERI